MHLENSTCKHQDIDSSQLLSERKKKPIKYLGKLYYKVDMELNGERFKSRVIDYFYICQTVSRVDGVEFGVDGEFSKNDRKYTKTSLSLEDLKKINHKDLNDMDKKNFDNLIEYMENLK